MWQELKGSKSGYKFSREISIGPYFADFCCRQYKLVVEVDGESHDRKPEDDEARDDGITGRNYKVLRFSNEQVMERTAQVVATIVAELEKRTRLRY